MPRTRAYDLDPTEEKRIYYAGMRLFNAGSFFEAHETWEDVWHLSTGKKRMFYQGLIQAAVMFEHLRRGNRRGVLSLYRTCVPKFDALPPVYMGVEIMPFLRKVRAGIAHVLDNPDAEVRPVPETQFQMVLQYDPFETPHETDVP